MEPVIRSVIIYGILWLVFRVIGRKSLADINTFDLVLLLLISQATQQALVRGDYSITNAFLVVVTLVGLQTLVTLMKRQVPDFSSYFDGGPVLLIEHGELRRDVMERVRIEEADILAAARRQRGIERLEQIKYAVLESSGGISIIAKEAI